MTTSPRFTVLVASFALLGSACASFGVSRADTPGSPVVASIAVPTPPTDGFVGGPEGDGAFQAAVADAVDAPQPDALPGPGQWIARSNTPTLTVWADPGRGATARFAVETTNPWDQPIVYPVMHARQTRDGTVWYRIMLGIEPNGSNGWIRASDVTVSQGTDRIVVDMSRRILRHLRDGKLLHRFVIGIGALTTPTTPGRFFVWASLQPSDATGSYGSYLLGLSGFSEVLTDWPGGGRMAIHGTADPTDRGREVSFGCIRVYNTQMDQLRDVPMGTVVTIKE